MAEVDADDDTVWRWVVWHRRYDPRRREWRPVVDSAYDNEDEFTRRIDQLAALVTREQAVGNRDARESVSGTAKHPGYAAEQRRARSVRRAIAHGANPRPLKDGPLPSSKAVFGADDDGTSFSVGGGRPPRPPARSVKTRIRYLVEHLSWWVQTRRGRG